MRIEGIQHVNLNVRDVARARAFYEDVLGFSLSFEKNGTAWVAAGRDLLGLSLGEPPRDNPNHWGFQVRSRQAVDAWAEHLKAKDVPIDKGPYDRSDGRGLYFRDPDGYVLEIFFLDLDAL